MTNEEKIQQIRRMRELFRPIDRQIMMTDDKNDLILLATVMLTTSKKILEQQFGKESTVSLITIIANQ